MLDQYSPEHRAYLRRIKMRHLVIRGTQVLLLIGLFRPMGARRPPRLDQRLHFLPSVPDLECRRPPRLARRSVEASGLDSG